MDMDMDMNKYIYIYIYLRIKWYKYNVEKVIQQVKFDDTKSAVRNWKMLDSEFYPLVNIQRTGKSRCET